MVQHANASANGSTCNAIPEDTTPPENRRLSERLTWLLAEGKHRRHRRHVLKEGEHHLRVLSFRRDVAKSLDADLVPDVIWPADVPQTVGAIVTLSIGLPGLATLQCLYALTAPDRWERLYLEDRPGGKLLWNVPGQGSFEDLGDALAGAEEQARIDAETPTAIMETPLNHRLRNILREIVLEELARPAPILMGEPLSA